MGEPKAVLDLANEAEHRSFWQTHDIRYAGDWAKAEAVRFSYLEPSALSISLRLPQAPLDDLKIAAIRCHVPCQSLIKLGLAEWPPKEGKARANER